MRTIAALAQSPFLDARRMTVGTHVPLRLHVVMGVLSLKKEGAGYPGSSVNTLSKIQP
ncbi:hypothetical protein ACKZDW_00225 (plasmid) [Ralstonia syzygii subsp. celebesensis]